MRKDKDRAILLRKEGKSYSEISQMLNISKSTLFNWFKGELWSINISKVLKRKVIYDSNLRLIELNKNRKKMLDEKYKYAKKEAKEQYLELKNNPLFVAGLMIYWGEGDKTSKYRISIANTDARMIRIFRLFIENILNVNNAKAWLLLYPDLDETICKNYWIQNSGLKQDYFNKSMVIRGKSLTKRLSYGVCNLGISSAYLKSKIFVWMDLIVDDLVS